MNATVKTLTLTAILVAGSILVAGCTPAPETTATPAPSISASAAPVESTEPNATEAPEAPADAKTGDVIDADTAAAVNAAATRPNSDRAYELPNGEHVFLTGGEALPDAVVKSATATVDAVSAPLATGLSVEDRPAAEKAFLDARDAESAKTGRNIIVVSHLATWDDSSKSYRPAWVVSEPGPRGEFAGKEAAVAAAEGWVANSPGTRAFIIIDAYS